MNRIPSVLDAEDVRVDVAAGSRLALVVEAAMIFKRRGWVAAPSTVTDALIAREQLASTGLGHGVAIPHAEILAEIAEMLSDNAVRERLKHEGDSGFVYATIARWTPHVPR